MFFKSLHSPLVGTAGVLAALGLLAIPLRHLTSAAPARPNPAAIPHPTATATTPAVLRLKLLTPARSIRVHTGNGEILLDLTNVPAGESEHDASLPLHGGILDLLLESDFGDSPSDTAIFLTVMPDACEEQTRYVIGRGKLAEPLRYDWHPH
ncbi:MAG: hypothetical protein WCO57_16420 [Verrucomicrobiota bacterium]